jgi:S-adenosylmethionine synthetase
MPVSLYPAEAVFPGHPDKLCDAIADGLVQEASRRQKRALCGVEVSVHRDQVFITGRIACTEAQTIDTSAVVRSIFTSAGYGSDWYPAPAQLHIHADLCLGPLNEGEDDFRRFADDQMRLSTPSLRLGPDGKVLVVLEEGDDSYRLSAVSVSLQQAIGGPEVELHRAVRAVVQQEVQESVWRLPGFSPALPEEIHVNGAGNFRVGGPQGDNGLAGKKLVVDAYGPRVPIGGGALSGKDFDKADRAGALLARRLAKAVVLTGVARSCTATLAFFPGHETARVLSVRDQAGAELDVRRWSALIDLSLAGFGERYTNQVDLIEVSRRGHFTRGEYPWEWIHLDGGMDGVGRK